MNEKTADFLRENGLKLIPLEIEFSVIYNGIVSLTKIALSEYTSEETTKSLTYCINALIFRTIEKFPESAIHILHYRLDPCEDEDIVRSHLYAHKLVTICNPKYQARLPVQQRLKDAWFEGRVDPVTGERFRPFQPLGKDGICRMLFYETRLLYQELKREFLGNKD
jgi:hypothetical protein